MKYSPCSLAQVNLSVPAPSKTLFLHFSFTCREGACFHDSQVQQSRIISVLRWETYLGKSRQKVCLGERYHYFKTILKLCFHLAPLPSVDCGIGHVKRRNETEVSAIFHHQKPHRNFHNNISIVMSGFKLG